MTVKILLLMIAGGLGATSRYLLSGVFQQKLGTAFPWGTLGVNLLGCFIFGLIWALSQERFALSGQVRFIILTGFVGSLTTFSTLTFEAFQLMRAAAFGQALLYLGVSQVSGLFMAWAGWTLVRFL